MVGVLAAPWAAIGARPSLWRAAWYSSVKRATSSAAGITRLIAPTPWPAPQMSRHALALLPPPEPKFILDASDSGSAKAWRDIWGAGQGVGLMEDVPTVAEMVERLKAQYQAARERLGIR